MKKLAALLVLVFGVIIMLCLPTKTIRFEKDVMTDNPAVGFAPSADNVDAAQSERLVYAEIKWSEWEPHEGKYDIGYIEEKYNLDMWRKAGKHLVIRFVCDVPGNEQHMDIPRWLYDKTGDGVFYDNDYGKGYCPDYSNGYFIAAHEKAITALGEYMSRDSFCLYAELGSLGHWGEWHITGGEGLPPIPNEDICGQYVKPYADSFKTARLLMRRPFSFVKKYSMGVYNDMTGDEAATNEWLGWIKSGGEYAQSTHAQRLTALPHIFDNAPVGGEFTSAAPLESMLGKDLYKTVSMIKASHMTFIGPMCPHSGTNQDAAAVNTVKAQLGYQYRVSSLSKKGSKYMLTLENDGAAPLYWDWDVCLYSLDEKYNVICRKKLDVKLSKLSGGKQMKISAEIYGKIIGIGIIDPMTGNPAVNLSMKCRKTENISIIYENKY